MNETAQRARDTLTAEVGASPLAGDWFEVDQTRINAFADATLDHQCIHVDPVRASESPFGGPIAHGFLTLSLLVHPSSSIESGPAFDGAEMSVNYGLNEVRFINPVPVGARLRATAQTIQADLKGSAVDVTRLMTVEIEEQEKPALVAEWIHRIVFRT